MAFENPPKWAYQDPEKYGLTPANSGLTCLTCAGDGQLDRPLIEGHPDVATEVTSCPECQGTGRPL